MTPFSSNLEGMSVPDFLRETKYRHIYNQVEATSCSSFNGMFWPLYGLKNC